MTLATLTLRVAALAAVPAVAVLAEAVPSTADETGDRDMPLRCEIVERPTATGVQLESHVHADTATRGRYSFNVTRVGGHGSSVIAQSGAFSVAAGRSARLGQASFGGDPGDYDVELILRWDGRRAVCRTASGARDL
jgi:hypothetical protein